MNEKKKSIKIVDHKDFVSADIEISLRNLVSQTVVGSKMKVIGSVKMGNESENNLVQFLEILPAGMVISVPTYTCSVGHQLELQLKVSKLTPKPFEIQVAGKVTEVEKASDHQVRVTIELNKLSTDKWNELCNLFSNKQDQIQNFFKMAKGY